MVNEFSNEQDEVVIKADMLEDGGLKTAMTRIEAGEDTADVAADVFDQSSSLIEPRDLAPGEMLESVELSKIGSPLTASDPERNVIYVDDKEPSTLLRNGNTKYELPDAETQRKGFYHPQASELIRNYPSKFKRFKRKGDK
jgi:hypothetical protein